MPPFLHCVILALLATFGMFVGAVTGQWVYDAWARVGIGMWSFPFLSLGSALAGLLSAVYLVDRFVPVHCPKCGGGMKKSHVRRNFLFTCQSCGWSQYG